MIVGVQAARIIGISPAMPILAVTLEMKKNKNPVKMPLAISNPLRWRREKRKENTAAINTIVAIIIGVVIILL